VENKLDPNLYIAPLVMKKPQHAHNYQGVKIHDGLLKGEGEGRF
jgi:hypothetical protein